MRWQNRGYDRTAENNTVWIDDLLCWRSIPGFRKRDADDDIREDHRWLGRRCTVYDRARLSIRDIASAQPGEACLRGIYGQRLRIRCQCVGGLRLQLYQKRLCVACAISPSVLYGASPWTG